MRQITIEVTDDTYRRLMRYTLYMSGAAGELPDWAASFVRQGLLAQGEVAPDGKSLSELCAEFAAVKS